MPVLNFSNAAKVAEANAVVALVGTNATLKFYSGAIPASPTTAPAGTLLGTLTWTSSFSGGVSAAGVINVNTPNDGTAVANGEVSFVRISKSDGTGVMDLDVGLTNAASIVVPTTTITTGLILKLSSLNITI